MHVLCDVTPLTFLVLLLPSAESIPDKLRLPTRSVLKTPVSSQNSAPDVGPQSKDTNLTGMLESAIITLRGSDRAAKFDVYATLLNLFRAFEDLPERVQLFPHLTELFSQILADITRMDPDDANKPDYTLNTKAMKVAGFLLFDSEISRKIPIPLARALLEHSLKRMEVSTVSKATASHHLWLWQTQRLPVGAISGVLAERMLAAALKADFPSVVINTERMGVILRLLEQASECMSRNVEAWLPQVVNNLLDSNKQIRDCALKASLEAGKSLCKVASVGRCMQNHLKRQVEGKSYIDWTTERFRSIMQEPNGGIYVAHAWGAICTLSSSQNPEKSKTLMDWMHVLSIVFNSPSTENKVMAQSAWVRMIHYFANNGTVIYRTKNLEYLLNPMQRMLDKDAKVYDTVRMAAINTVCALIYSVNRPGMEDDQATLIWDQVVQSSLHALLEQSHKDALKQKAIEMLIALLEVKGPVNWSLDRLLEAKAVGEQEITQFQPRWIRRNMAKLSNTMLAALSAAVPRELKLRLWSALLSSLQAASAKEVQILPEALESTAVLCKIFHKIWHTPIIPHGQPSSEAAEAAKQNFNLCIDLINRTLDTLGPSTFVATTTSLPGPCTSDTARIEVGRNSSQAGTGFSYIFALFQKPASDVTIDTEYIDTLDRILSRIVASQKSSGKVLGLLSSCLSSCQPVKSYVPTQSWKILADIAHQQITMELKQYKANTTLGVIHSKLDSHYDPIRAILKFGIQVASSIPEWESLARSFGELVLTYDNMTSLVSNVIEWLASSLRQADCFQMSYITVLLEMAAKPSLLVGQPVKSTCKDSGRLMRLPDFVAVISEGLQRMNRRWKFYKLSEDHNTFLELIAILLDDHEESSAAATMQALQCGLLPLADRVEEPAATQVCISYLNLLRKDGTYSQEALRDSTDFLTAGLNSGNALLRDAVKELWRDTFGKKQDLALTEELERSLGLCDQQSLEKSTSDKMLRSSARDQTKSHDSGSLRSLSRRSSGFLANLPISNLDEVSSKPTRKRKRSVSTNPRGSCDHVQPLCNDEELPIDKPINSPRTDEQVSKRQCLEVDAESKELPETTVDLTLYKRDLAGPASPQLMSDPVSESSPSVMSRLRRGSYSASPFDDMAAMRHTARSLSPIECNDRSPLPLEMPDIDDSDNLMELQITGNHHANTEAVQEDGEQDDEELFLLQLQQYRASLAGGKPITPRRRERIGRLMKELTHLGSEVTDLFFAT